MKSGVPLQMLFCSLLIVLTYEQARQLGLTPGEEA